MFEKFKLNYYSDKLIGYAYDFTFNSDNIEECNIYLVIYENSRYKFIKLSKIIISSNVNKDILVKCFDNYNIKYITYWLDTFVSDKNVILDRDSRKKILNLVRNISN